MFSNNFHFKICESKLKRGAKKNSANLLGQTICRTVVVVCCCLLLLLLFVVCCCCCLLLPGVVIVVVMLVVVVCWFCFLGNLHANNCLILFRTALGIINWQFYGLLHLLLPFPTQISIFSALLPLCLLSLSRFCLRWLRIYILTTGKKQVRSERSKKVKLI